MRLRKYKVPALLLVRVLLPLLVLTFAPRDLAAQAKPAGGFGLDKGQTPAMELGFGYTYLHANAPPAACGCFSLNGGSATWVINAPHGISIVADLTAAHASQVDGTSQNITLFNALFGPRYTLRNHRFSPYVEALVGTSNESSNYAFVQDVSALAAMGGGGISAVLNRHIGLNIVEADYIYSRLPNAVNNTQNDLRVRTGVVFRFGPR